MLKTLSLPLVAVATLAALVLDPVAAFQPAVHGGQHALSRTTTTLLRSSAEVTAAILGQGGNIQALVDIRETARRDVPAMEAWAATAGAQRAPALQLQQQDEAGTNWGCLTSEALPANSPLLVISNDMILSASKAQQELQGSVDAAVDQLGRMGAGAAVPEFYLLLKILREYEQAEASPWFAWLDSLPRLYFNACSMTDFCYECLPPLVFSLARGDRVKVDNLYEALQKVDILSPATKANKDLVKWAYNVVSTRSWSTDPTADKKIVPLVDMFNHGTETEVDMAYDDDGNCHVYTTKEVAAGAPLRMSYGCPTNPSLFFSRYGFLDETSPATFCKIMTIQPTPELKDLGLDFSRMLFYKDSGDISGEVWDVMLYQSLASNREAQQALHTAHMSGDTDTKNAIHQHYFAQTSSALKTHVDTFLKQLDDLSAKGVGKDLNEHPRLPLILKHNEFVKSTFMAVKANLDPMVAQAAEQ